MFSKQERQAKIFILRRYLFCLSLVSAFSDNFNFPASFSLISASFCCPTVGAFFEDPWSRFYHTSANPIIVQVYTLINICYFLLLLVFFVKKNIFHGCFKILPHDINRILVYCQNELLFSVNLANIPLTDQGKKNSPKHGKK